MKPGYEPKNFNGALGHLIEEAAEVQKDAAEIQKLAGKILRFGLMGSNPDLPPEERETNLAAVLRNFAALRGEMADLTRAMEAFERWCRAEEVPTDPVPAEKVEVPAAAAPKVPLMKNPNQEELQLKEKKAKKELDDRFKALARSDGKKRP